MHISLESDMTSFRVSLFSRIRERRSLGFCLDAWEEAEAAAAAAAVVGAVADEEEGPLLDDRALIFANSPPPTTPLLFGEVVSCVGEVGGVTSVGEFTMGSETPSVGDSGCA